MSVDVQQITGNARSVAQLLSNNRFRLEEERQELYRRIAELVWDPLQLVRP